MARKKREKTKIELVSEEIREVLSEYKCNIYAIPKFVPVQRKDGTVLFEIQAGIKILEIKEDDKEAKSE